MSRSDLSTSPAGKPAGLRRAVVGLMAAVTAGALAWALTPAALAAAPPSTPLEQVQAQVQPGVVYEQITWTAWVYDETNDQYFTEEPFTASFQCTGFVINPDGYIATAGHCVELRDDVRAALLNQVVDWAYNNGYYQASPSRKLIATFARHWRLDGMNTTGKPDQEVTVAYGVSVSGEPSGKALPARVVGFRGFDDGDVALLKIDAENLTVLTLSDNEDTRVGTEVVSVGYPASVDLVTDQTFDPSFKEGSVSAEKTTAGGLLPVYEISAALSGGMSGGPTTALDGRAIGVNSFGVSGETQSFNFVQPSQTLQELLRSEGVQNTTGEVTDLYRAGLRAYFAGEREESIKAFDEVLQIVPNHEFAQEYRRRAQELPESSSLLGMPLWLVGLLGLIALAIVVGAVVLLSRRRGSSPAAPTGPPVTMPPPAAAPSSAPAAAPAAPSSSAPAAAPAVPSSSAPVAAAAVPPGSEPAATPAVPPPVVPEAAPPPAAPQPPAEPMVVASPPPEAETTPAHHRFCPECGAPHDEGAHFCENCGHKLV